MRVLLLFALSACSPQTNVPLSSPKCAESVARLESSLPSVRLTDNNLRKFEMIALDRKKRKIDIFPDDLMCSSVRDASNELMQDDPTRKTLAENGLSAEEYILLGWAMIIATDDGFFDLDPPMKKLALENRSTLRDWPKIIALIRGK